MPRFTASEAQAEPTEEMERFLESRMQMVKCERMISHWSILQWVSMMARRQQPGDGAQQRNGQ